MWTVKFYWWEINRLKSSITAFFPSPGAMAKRKNILFFLQNDCIFKKHKLKFGKQSI